MDGSNWNGSAVALPSRIRATDRMKEQTPKRRIKPRLDDEAARRIRAVDMDRHRRNGLAYDDIGRIFRCTGSRAQQEVEWLRAAKRQAEAERQAEESRAG